MEGTDGVDIYADHLTFSKQVTIAYGKVLSKMVAHLVARASWEQHHRQPHNALRDAESALNLIQYIDGVKLPGLYGFIAQIYLELGEVDKAESYIHAGLNQMDNESVDYLKDLEFFKLIENRIQELRKQSEH